jgi:hypothetical protein
VFFVAGASIFRKNNDFSTKFDRRLLRLADLDLQVVSANVPVSCFWETIYGWIASLLHGLTSENKFSIWKWMSGAFGHTIWKQKENKFSRLPL